MPRTSADIVVQVTTRPGLDGKEQESASVWVKNVGAMGRYATIKAGDDGTTWGLLTSMRPNRSQYPAGTPERLAEVEAWGARLRDEARRWVHLTFGYAMPLDGETEGEGWVLRTRDELPPTAAVSRRLAAPTTADRP